LNDRLARQWMRAGVTIVDPGTVWLDVTVTLEPDVTLRPGVQLHGRTTVGAGADIGPDTTLVDTVVGPGATVARTHARGATIGADAEVGPFTYLRPGATLGSG